MKFALSDLDSEFIITAYNSGEFTVSGRHYQGSLLVRSDRPPEPLPFACINDFNSEGLDSLPLDNLTTLLIGTGDSLIFPDDDILSSLYEAGIGVEIMDTAAACRTYNILVSEGRQVAAALVAIA